MSPLVYKTSSNIPKQSFIVVLTPYHNHSTSNDSSVTPGFLPQSVHDPQSLLQSTIQLHNFLDQFPSWSHSHQLFLQSTGPIHQSFKQLPAQQFPYFPWFQFFLQSITFNLSLSFFSCTSSFLPCSQAPSSTLICRPSPAHQSTT